MEPHTIRLAYGRNGEITSATFEFDGGKEVRLVREIKLPKPQVGKHSAYNMVGYAPPTPENKK